MSGQNIVFFVTDSAERLPTFRITRAIANELGAIFTSLSPAEPSGSVAELTNEATVVVAHVAKGTPNLFYEIGLAHGRGKPVVLLASDPADLPFDLRLYKTLSLPLVFDESNEKQFRFKLAQTIKALIDNPLASFGYALNWTQHQLPAKPTPPSVRTRQRELARGLTFEYWFRELVGKVEGWDLIEAEDPPDAGYDLVVWNRTMDPELGLLGNPIPIELKSKPPNRRDIEELAHRASLQGLKGVILASRKGASQAARQLVHDVFRKSNFAIVLLDSGDLESIGSAGDLTEAVRDRIRAFRSV